MAENPRRPWLAALLSLLLAGLGHLYAGRFRRAAAFFGGEIAAIVAGLLVLVSWPAAPWNLVAGNGVLLGWRVVAGTDAFRCAARTTVPSGRPAWVRWPAYLAVYGIVLYGAARALKATAFEAFRLPTGAMSDTLLPGDRFVATKWDAGSPERGEIVLFRGPGGVNYVFRVVGRPGERVEVREGRAFVDGEPLDEPFLRLDGRDAGAFGPAVVPPGCYFVLGDRRHHSWDSRAEGMGFVREDAIFARPRAVFWSRDPETDEMRWDRLGRPVR